MKKPDRSPLGVGVPLLLLLLIFLVSAAVLLQVFAAAWSMSRQAEETNGAVQLCRNAAEAFSAAGSSEGASALLGCTEPSNRFDRSLSPAADGIYQLQWETSDEKTAAGILHSAVISVLSGDRLLYSLKTAVYEKGAAQ